MHICMYVDMCVYACEYLRLKSGVILNNSFTLFIQAGYLSQTKIPWSG